MPCVHLNKLYQLCQDEGLRLGGSDLIHVICPQCGVQDVCPSMLSEQYEALHPEDFQSDDGDAPTESRNL